MNKVKTWFESAYFFRFSLTWSSPILSSLSNSFIMASGFWIWTDSIRDCIKALLFISISKSMFKDFRISDARARHSASAFIEGSPIMSASHCVNCLNLLDVIGSSLKTGPIWYLLKGNLRFGFCLKSLWSWNVNSYLRPRFLPARSFNLKRSETASSSSAGRESPLISSSNSIIGVSRGTKP